jgi:tetratricopeptide (TPR) repeat protein
VETHFDSARAAQAAGRLAEAEAGYRAAIAEEPARAANELGALLFGLGRTEEALALFLRALAAEPAWAKPRYNLGLACLALGNYELGWLLHEARRQVAEVAPRELPLPFPEWRDERLRGRRIVVLGEQGFGDQIMFARFLPELRRLGAETRYFCGAEVAPLFAGATASLDTDEPADFWVLAGSLPLRLGSRLETLPPPLAPATPLGAGGGVGVVARGRAAHGNDRNRSLAGADADRLLALGRDLSPERTGARDFLDTATIVADLDLVISVDTAVAHLAASLGKPTWILLPAVGTDWRWLRGRASSPWYPSARLFRQPTAGDWPSVLDEVEAALGAERRVD